MGLKFNLSMLFAAVTSASLTFAAASVDTRLSNLEREVSEMRVETAMGNYGITTASASPAVDGKGFFINGGPIYQHANVNGTEFTYTDDDPFGTPPIHGRTKEMKFNRDWGLRFGIGYNFEYDNWDMYLNYTWFDSSGSRSVDAGLNGGLIPLRSSSLMGFCGGVILGVAAEIAKSQYDVDFNIINLELGRAYFISGKLSLRPHFGLQNTWIDLQQVTRYSGGDFEQHTLDVKEESDFWGLGPRAGVDTKWYLGCKGFNIFGNVSGALLYGNFDVDHREKFTLCPDEGLIRLDANKHRFVPTTQFQLGLGWERYFKENKVHFALKIGYDAQFFWRANQMLRMEDFNIGTLHVKYNRYTEDVSMQGLMIDARLNF